jgi:hypothetical protein
VKQRTIAAVIVLLLFAVACSSSTNSAKRTTSDARARAQASADATGSSAPGTRSSASTGTGSRAAGPGGATSGSASGAGAGNSVGVPGGGGAPRKLSGEIEVGISFISDAGTVFGQFGVNNPGASDTNEATFGKNLKPLIDYVNARGGLGGRELVPVYHGVASLRGNFDSQSQETCAAFTEDHDAAAVIHGALIPTYAVADCLYAKKVPLVQQFQIFADDVTFAHYGKYLYMPWSISADRLGIWLDRLFARGFFGSKAKVGVIRKDEPISKRFLDRVVVPKLKAHGLKVDDDYPIDPITAAGDAGKVAAAENNAILRFKSKGITNVLFFPSEGVLTLLWGQFAEDQGFRARWSFTSFDAPYLTTENNPPSQLARAWPEGWMPELDIVSARDFPSGNPSQDLCMKLLKPTYADNASAGLRYCDGVFLLKAAYDRAADMDRGFTPDDLALGAESLGTSYRSAWTFTSRIARDQHDGATSVRDLKYVHECTCFLYTGSPFPVR